MKRLTTTTLLVLASCAKVEEGVDTTIIRGNIVIPPATFEEPADDGETANDTWASATELPLLTFRRMAVTGTAQGFGTIDTESDVVEALGNQDYYTIAAKADGELSLALDFVTNPGMGRDKTILLAYLYDLDNAEETCTTSYSCAAADCSCAATWDEGSAACIEAKGCEETCTWDVVETETCLPVPIAGGSTDGTLGHFEASLPVQAGGNYGIEIVAGDSTEYKDSAPYTLSFGALTPADDLFLVGAYESQDVTARGNPLGGASVYDMQWDEANGVWTGKFEIVHIKKVVTTEECTPACIAAEEACGCSAAYDVEAEVCVEAEGCKDSCTWTPSEDEEVCRENHEVTESVPTVYLMGGTWPTLNASIPSGALYSSTAVEVATGDGDDHVGTWGLDTANPDEGDDDTTDTADTAVTPPEPLPLGEIVVYMDALQPRVIGWQFAEVEPNDVTLNEDVTLLVDELGLANELPPASGPGFVDIISGNVEITEDVAGWGVHPLDVFALTVPETVNASFVFEWDDPSADHDFLLYDDAGLYWAYSLYDYPEIIDTAAWEFSLPAGTTWYIGVLPYAGQVGNCPYTIEIEYAGL